MTRLVLASATACVTMGVVLIVLAWRRLGIAWRVLRATTPDALGAAGRGPCTLVGVVEPAGELVLAPFTERPVLYVRAVLRGVGPEGGPERVLWEKVAAAPARLHGDARSVALKLEGAVALVRREYRQGALRALVPEVAVLPRALVRAGYIKPPPSMQFFHLEEEVIAPGEQVYVLGEHHDGGGVAGGDRTPLVISNLSQGRVLLRVAWGPVLAALLAVIIVATGGALVVTALWLG